jgi:AraC family transcriptional regulator, transcriptional activator of pobA
MKNRIFLSGQGFNATYGRYSVQVSNVLSYTMDINPTNKRHSHSEYEFNLVVSGTGKYFEGDHVYELKRGDIFVSDPFVVHEISCRDTKDLHFMWINVYLNQNGLPTSETYEDRLLDEFVHNHQTYIEKQYFMLDYLPQLSRGVSSMSQRKLSCQFLTKALFFDFIELTTHTKLDLENPDSLITKKPFSYINRASNFIINNLNSKLTVKEIADAVYTSERNLRYLFRQHLNSTVVGFINDKKMEHAVHLLSLMMPVQDVCETLHIADPSQFSRLFKKHYQISPKQYQMDFLRQRCKQECK